MERAAVIERDMQIRGVRLHVLEAGDGPLVVLLHGFPEFSYAWRKQIPALVAAGFRVLAPDQRGYGASEKPESVRDYRVEELAADVAALVESSGRRKAAIIGHDWGGIVAYYTAMFHPECVDRLVVINAPHPALYQAVVRRHPSQLARSWYALLFQIPLLPEAFARRTMRWWGRWLQRDAGPGSYTDEDIRRYVDAWSRPGAMRAGINYYRALFARRLVRRRGPSRRIDAPTLILWGDRDRYLRPENADPDPAYLPHAEVVHFPQASHWLPNEEPARVNALILAFLRR